MKYLPLEDRIREVLEMWRFPMPIHDEDGRLNKCGVFLLSRVMEEINVFYRSDHPLPKHLSSYFFENRSFKRSKHK